MPSKAGTSTTTSGRYLRPGVSVEEVDSGSRPIEGVGTAVAAFVGFAERGPVRRTLTILAIVGVVIVVVRGRRH